MSESNGHTNKSESELQYSLASQQYLRPVRNIGNAKLRLTTDKNAEHFIVEIFESRIERVPYIDPVDGKEKMREVEHATSPHEIEALYFCDRFKHGCRKITRQNVMHPIFEVPITDYSVELIRQAWTGPKQISEMAKPAFQKIFLREFQAEQNAKRTAAFMTALDKGDAILEAARIRTAQIIDSVPQETLYEFDNYDEWCVQECHRITEAAELEAEELIDKTVPTTPFLDEFCKHLHDTGINQTGVPFKMKHYQKVGAYNGCLSGGFGQLLDPGLGKTLMMICELDYSISRAEAETDDNGNPTPRETISLVACPKTICSNWVNEISKFSMYGNNATDPKKLNQIYCIIPEGAKPIDRYTDVLSKLGDKHDDQRHVVVLMGYESFVQTPRLHEFEWDNLFIDESHNFANPTTKRTKTFTKLRCKFNNVTIATGTFFRNNIFDSFGQLELIHEGASGFTSYEAQKKFYGQYESQGRPGNQREKLVGFDTSRIPLMQERMARYTFIMKKERALPYLPKKTHSIRECILTGEQKEVYMQLAIQLMAEVESYGPEPDTMTVNNILTQMLRLAQVTSGYAALDDGRITRFNENPKLDLLCNLLLGSKEESDESEIGSTGLLTNTNNKVIIWCAFKENLRMIHSRLKLQGLDGVMFHGSSEDKDDITTTFNCDPKCRFFAGIAKSGGVGLNLVGFDPHKPQFYKTNTVAVINYSSNWSYVDREQGENRAHRYNTRVPISVIDLLAAGSIDWDIYNRLKLKHEMSTSMQDIKGILKGILTTLKAA